MRMTKGTSAAGRTCRVLVTVAGFSVVITAALPIAPQAHAAEGDIAFHSCTVATEPNINGQPPTGAECTDQSPSFRSLNQPTDVAVAENGHVYATGVFLGESVTHLAPEEDGDLTIDSCVDAGATVTGCDDLGLGADNPLDGPEAIATYEDDVYVADLSSGSVVHLVTASDGELSFADCVTVGAPTTACTDIPGTDALEDITSITVAPDGKNVYVGSGNKSAITNLARAANGALAFEDCITGGEFSASTTGCNDVSGTTEGIDPADLAADPGGGFIYMTPSGASPDTFVQLRRGAGGTLSFQAGDCITGPSTDFGCDQLAGNQQTAFDGVFGVGVVDGGHIYVTASQSDSVIHLERDSTGALSFSDCITSDASIAACDPNDISGVSNSLQSVTRLAISPFGDDVIVGSAGRGAIVFLDRSFTDGSLSFTAGSCVTTNVGTNGGCEDRSSDTNVFDAIADIAVSPDGQSIYSVGNNPDAATRLTRVPATIPNTTITSGPSGPTADSTPTFGFSSTEPGTSNCQVDGGAYSPCTSPTTLAALADGDHTLSVRATDTDGHDDPTPASRGFTVDTTGPATSLGGRKKQKSSKALKVKVTCDEACTATLAGNIKIPVITGSATAAKKKKAKLKAKTLTLAAGETKTTKLKPNKKGRKLLKKALKAGKKSKAMITVEAVDALENRTDAKRRIIVKKKAKS